jgi:hypothetical protein
MRFLDYTQRCATGNRTPLDEWSARHRDLYLKTHNIHNRQTSMTMVGFEPTTPAVERPQIYTLEHMATRTGLLYTAARFNQILLNLSNKPNLTAFLLHRLPYNEAFLREVMRKETLVPLSVVHRCTEDTQLNGYFIPKVSSGTNLRKVHITIRNALFTIQ